MAYYLKGEELTRVWEGNDDVALLLDLLLQNQVKRQCDLKLLWSSCVDKISLKFESSWNVQPNAFEMEPYREYFGMDRSWVRNFYTADQQFMTLSVRSGFDCTAESAHQYQMSAGVNPRTLPRVEITYVPFPERVQMGFDSFIFPESPTVQLATAVQSTSIIKIPIYAAFGGAIIGRKGVNAKRICNETGLRKLTVQNHSLLPNVKYLIMEGSIKVLCAAIRRVSLLISQESLSGKLCDWKLRHAYFKTKLCRKFVSGFCSRGYFCDYAHGEHEIRVVPTHCQSK